MLESSKTLVESGARWVCIFAHPGHELRVHHLLERVRPTVAVVTDGSGSTGRSRLAQTGALLASVGANTSSVFGPLNDREAYAALLAADAAPFLVLRDQLAALLVNRDATSVVIDAAEGYNPVHDVCHWLGRAAVSLAAKAGRAIDCFELDLVSHPNGDGAGIRLGLDDQSFARKLQAVSDYDVLAQEAGAAFMQYGQDAFRVEFLRRIVGDAEPPASWTPYYEEVGAARVKAGLYSSVLRYAHHVRPVIETLLKHRSPTLHVEDLGSLYQ